MPRPSSITQLAPEVRARLDEALLLEPASAVAARFNVSASAVYRYRARALQPEIAQLLTDPTLTPTPDLVERISEIARDLALVRRSMLRAGQVTSAARAADSELRALQILTTTLGIDNQSVVELLDAGKKVARATARAVRRTPEVGRAIADELRELDAVELAEALEDLMLGAAVANAQDVSENNEGAS